MAGNGPILSSQTAAVMIVEAAREDSQVNKWVELRLSSSKVPEKHEAERNVTQFASRSVISEPQTHASRTRVGHAT